MPRPIAPAPITPMINFGELATLSALKPRLSLLDERANAFGVVVRATGLPLELCLERELRGEIVVQPRIEAALDESERTRRHSGEPPGEIEAGISENGRRDDVVDEPPLLGGPRIQLVAEHRERGRALIADESRKDERAAAVRDEADFREGLDERRVLRRQHEIAGEREVGAGARGDAVHGADDRLLERADAVDHRCVLPLDDLAEIRGHAILRQHGGEILSGAE